MANNNLNQAVDISGGQGVQVGDGNTQHNNFGDVQNLVLAASPDSFKQPINIRTACAYYNRKEIFPKIEVALESFISVLLISGLAKDWHEGLFIRIKQQFAGKHQSIAVSWPQQDLPGNRELQCWRNTLKALGSSASRGADKETLIKAVAEQLQLVVPQDEKSQAVVSYEIQPSHWSNCDQHLLINFCECWKDIKKQLHDAGYTEFGISIYFALIEQEEQKSWLGSLFSKKKQESHYPIESLETQIRQSLSDEDYTVLHHTLKLVNEDDAELWRGIMERENEHIVSNTWVSLKNKLKNHFSEKKEQHHLELTQSLGSDEEFIALLNNAPLKNEHRNQISINVNQITGN